MEILVLKSKHQDIYVSLDKGFEEAAKYVIQYNYNLGCYSEEEAFEANEAAVSGNAYKFISKRSLRGYEYEEFYSESVMIP